MRKWISGICILLALAVGGIYIFIPSQLTVTKITPVACTLNGTYTFLADQTKWHLWWPSHTAAGDSFSYNGYTYRVNQQLYNVVTVIVQNENASTNDTIAILPINKDSSYLRWSSILLTGKNPFRRIQQYQQATLLKNNMDSIASWLRTFLEKTENVYGTHIIKTKVKDTLLIATRQTFSAYPTTAEIYNMISRLKTNALQQGANESGFPMLNILKTGDNSYETYTALPIDKTISPGSGNFLKQMVPGNILVTETTGGVYSVNKAFRQLENYVNDHRLESPAIPFQSLITDRQAVPDTTKWVTKIYYPIF